MGLPTKSSDQALSGLAASRASVFERNTWLEATPREAGQREGTGIFHGAIKGFTQTPPEPSQWTESLRVPPSAYQSIEVCNGQGVHTGSGKEDLRSRSAGM